jgi:hypothetical protein
MPTKEHCALVKIRDDRGRVVAGHDLLGLVQT